MLVRKYGEGGEAFGGHGCFSGGITKAIEISFYRELFENPIRMECLIGESTDRSVWPEALDSWRKKRWKL